MSAVLYMQKREAFVEEIDAFVTDLFSKWNIYTTIITTVLFIYLVYPWLTWRDPDTHPLLLARQSYESPVRQDGQSAIYRSLEIPYSYPLRAGLGVKDPGAPKWSSGRNGDLRDIWRQAARGQMKDDGSLTGVKGQILTILGREKVTKHDLDSITQNINVIGKYIQDLKGQCVAISLSNSTEMISSIFGRLRDLTISRYF